VGEVPPPAGVVVLAGVLEVVVEAELVVELVVVVTAVELVDVVSVEPVGDVEPLLEPPWLSSVGLVRTGVSCVVLVGTTSATLLPPQAAITTPATRIAVASAKLRRRRTTASAPDRPHATPASGAVVEVALRELLAPWADAEILGRPGQLRA